jgi:hypothetical protein
MTKNWTVMNKLEESFSNITTVGFMLQELKEAIDSHRTSDVSDITHALNAYLPIYIANWDRSYEKAWEEVVGNQKECPHCDILSCADHLTDE